MYPKQSPNCPVKVKACMKWQPLALLCRQTHPITTRPDMQHSAIYLDFLYYLFLIQWIINQWSAVFISQKERKNKSTF